MSFRLCLPEPPSLTPTRRFEVLASSSCSDLSRSEVQRHHPIVCVVLLNSDGDFVYL
jgi:hypothetical protein